MTQLKFLFFGVVLIGSTVSNIFAESTCIIGGDGKVYCGKLIEGSINEGNKKSLSVCTQEENCPSNSIESSIVIEAKEKYKKDMQIKSKYHDCMDNGGYHSDCSKYL